MKFLKKYNIYISVGSRLNSLNSINVLYERILDMYIIPSYIDDYCYPDHALFPEVFIDDISLNSFKLLKRNINL